MKYCTRILPLPSFTAYPVAIAALVAIAAPHARAAEATNTAAPAATATSERLDALEAAGDYPALMKELAVPDRPDLPQMYFCGDSISQHNAPWVKVALNGKFDVTHWLDLPTRYPQTVPKTPYSGTSELLIEMLTTVLNSKEYHPKFLVLNAGLHDATYEIPVEQYRANLLKVIELAKQRRAKMAWMLTTPRTKSHAHNPRIDAYNAAAREIMKQHEVPVIALHRFVVDAVAQNGEPATYNGDDVHYSIPVRKQMGLFLGKELTRIFKDDLAASPNKRDAQN